MRPTGSKFIPLATFGFFSCVEFAYLTFVKPYLDSASGTSLSCLVSIALHAIFSNSYHRHISRTRQTI